MSRYLSVTVLSAHEYDDNLYHERPPGLSSGDSFTTSPWQEGRSMRVVQMPDVCVCVCVCVCVLHVCVIMHVWAVGTRSSPPRSEEAAVFISLSHWLCIQGEFRLCDYNEDITMDSNAVDAALFPKLISETTRRWLFFFSLYGAIVPSEVEIQKEPWRQLSRLRFRQSGTCDLTLKVASPMPLWWRLHAGARAQCSCQRQNWPI